MAAGPRSSSARGPVPAATVSATAASAAATRLLDAVGHPVIALHREAFGPLALGNLPRGASRPLAEAEVARLKELAS